ncbi:Cyclic AMP-responsive element-binding protein 3-like protein 2 [Willisornis vidua]|uniref:Cyclic AMP-responsive element-binding protein 3-like protein 2 n=1 Tax=Willisornis vidua TaxID=1566151 RepID=A0ABQ9CWH2_9PASS|nr:Cyclic AMP-responsive element-binding protein 3-like protein 2 [Willisornis vidua]
MEVCESGGEQPPLLHWDRKLSELCEPADPDTLLSHTLTEVMFPGTVTKDSSQEIGVSALKGEATGASLVALLKADNDKYHVKQAVAAFGEEDVVHFTEFLDEFSPDVLGQLLNDPFLSEKNEIMEVELSPASPAPLIQAEHSYSLCGDSRPQSPLTHISADDNFNEGDLENEEWCLATEFTPASIKTEPGLCETSGLAPSVSLTVTATSLEGEQPELQTDALMKPLTQKVLPEIKLEPHEVDQFLNLSSKEAVDPLHLPPTPPSSHGSDSEGGQSPARSLPPSSPIQLQATAKVASRTASVLTNSPLLTAPHMNSSQVKIADPVLLAHWSVLFPQRTGTGPLILTEEEKRTLIAEGYPIPTKLPLTKAEEKVLKKIRRKIKNKISAQESRRKKKEYMDSLEKKVETCSNENSELRKKVEVLENTNRTLLQQLQRLQAMVAGKVSRSCKAASTQTGTCLMMVVLCFAVVFGSFSQSYGPYPSATKMVLPRQHSSPESYTDSIVRSRSLLIYEEPHQLEESSSPISFADRSDRQTDTSKYTTLSLEAVSGTQQDDVMQFTIANETRLEKSVLLGLQQHRVNSELEGNETLKIIEIDRRVNATS